MSALDSCAVNQSSGAAVLLFQALMTNLKMDQCGISPPSKWSPDAAPTVLAESSIGGNARDEQWKWRCDGVEILTNLFVLFSLRSARI